MLTYARLKRHNQTIFLQVDPTDSFKVVKGKVANTTMVAPEDIRLIAKDSATILEDDATLGDQQHDTGDVIFWVMKTDDGGYEDIALQDITQTGEEKQ